VDFERLYRETYPRVLAYARSVASRENADDAVAETYAIAWRRQRDIPRNAELGWLIGVRRSYTIPRRWQPPRSASSRPSPDRRVGQV
jgi:RNA polymerase sigma-70 factor (ECF subfamily)